MIYFKSLKVFEMDSKTFILNADDNRKEKIPTISVRYVKSEIRGNLINVEFETTTNEKGTIYNQTIQILDVPEKINKKTITKSIGGNLKVDCTCPDYLYQGYKYIGTIKDYAINPEDIEPKNKNPELIGTVCKHLLAVIDKLPKNILNIIKDIK
jgi:hypothetical protein